MYYIFDFLTVASICVVLPVLIVWLIMRKSMNETNKLSQIIITAMEKNINIDIESLTKLLHKSPKKNITSKFLTGNICSGVGIAITIFFVIIYSANDSNLNDLTGCLLLLGSILIALGIAFYITYFVEKKSNN